MIENLSGIHETVNFKTNTHLRLYLNEENECYPKHWHTPIEIILVTEGNYFVKIGDCNVKLNTGDILLICPGVIHSLHAPETGNRIILLADISILRCIQKLESVLSFISPAITITPDNAPNIHARSKDLLMKINSTYNDISNTLSEVMIYSYLLEFFSIIGQNYTKNMVRFDVGDNKQIEYTNKFISICNHINEHCTEDLSLDEIAKIAGFSKFHFSRLFKQFSNVTFYKYLNQKRIAHAEILLSDPEISITEIALNSGFTSLSAFIRMFKLHKHCTPTEFRKMYIS